MSTSDDAIHRILESLRERAKELECLYRVDRHLADAHAPLAEVLAGIAAAIPPGYQYPDVCAARVLLEGVAYGPPGFQPTAWVQRAGIAVQGEPVGAVEVAYKQAMPRADEGPFLKEERRLIDSIAERLGHHLMQRRMQAALEEWRGGSAGEAPEPRSEWRLIIGFLALTDRQLLARLSRRMLNHLGWNGVAAAQRLLQDVSPPPAGGADAGTDDNQPLAVRHLRDPVGLAEETFRLAEAHLGEDEMVRRVQGWIKDDKASFLLQALEDPASTLSDLTESLRRYRHITVAESELSPAMQTALRVDLLRRFFTDDVAVIRMAKDLVSVSEFTALAERVIGPPHSHGRLGGKSTGLYLASLVVRGAPAGTGALAGLRLPRSWYIASDGLLDFIQHNQLDDVYSRKYLELEQIRREYPHIVQVFKNSRFSPEMTRSLSLLLDDFAERPLIVRSSSLLEDRTGAAFSGKYKSLFLANRGSKQERLAALADAVAEVYASIFSPDALEYRAERGLLDLHEEMAILIQEVVGQAVGRYFLPAFSGVAFSNNEFRWSPRIRREDGLVRLVPGLGTRAVDRLPDDYPVLIAPGQPGLRASVSPDEVARYSPRWIDVINLETRSFETVEVRAFLRECGERMPLVGEIVSRLGSGVLQRPGASGAGLDFAHDDLVVTFDGLATRTPFVGQIRTLLQVLGARLEAPVDVEFACDGSNLYLLQCRSQTFAEDTAPAVLPGDIDPERILFTASRHVSNGRVPDLSHVVYVDPAGYGALPDLAQLRDVGRAIGRLNKLLPRRRFLLMGPGRWGSRGDVRLGVSVTYSDIHNTALLIEVARREGPYLPDVSFGTHFFQDLVEASIRYLPLYPDDPGVRFNEAFLRGGHDLLPEILPEYAHLSGTLRVIDVPAATGGLVLRVLMNAEQDRAIGYLATPAAGVAG